AAAVEGPRPGDRAVNREDDDTGRDVTAHRLDGSGEGVVGAGAAVAQRGVADEARGEGQAGEVLVAVGAGRAAGGADKGQRAKVTAGEARAHRAGGAGSARGAVGVGERGDLIGVLALDVAARDVQRDLVSREADEASQAGGPTGEDQL